MICQSSRTILVHYSVCEDWKVSRSRTPLELHQIRCNTWLFSFLEPSSCIIVGSNKSYCGILVLAGLLLSYMVVDVKEWKSYYLMFSMVLLLQIQITIHCAQLAYTWGFKRDLPMLTGLSPRAFWNMPYIAIQLLSSFFSSFAQMILT